MAQKNEAPILALALLLTLGLIGGGLWVFKEPLSSLFGQSSTSASASSSTNSSLNPSAISPSSNRSAENYSTLAQAQGIPDGLFNYGGSTTWAPIRGEVDPLIQTVWPLFKLRYTDPISESAGSGSGIRMVLENQLAFAQSSRPIKLVKQNNQTDQKAGEAYARLILTSQGQELIMKAGFVSIR